MTNESMTDNPPQDWFVPGTDSGERCYWITREGVIMLAMSMDGKVATQARVEIAQIVGAWYRGEIFPRSAAPTVAMLLDYDSKTPHAQAKRGTKKIRATMTAFWCNSQEHTEILQRAFIASQ